MILRRPMKARENKKSEKEEKELNSIEKQCNNCLLQRKLWHLESVQLKETRLKNMLEKTFKHLLESPKEITVLFLWLCTGNPFPLYTWAVSCFEIN